MCVRERERARERETSPTHPTLSFFLCVYLSLLFLVPFLLCFPLLLFLFTFFSLPSGGAESLTTRVSLFPAHFVVTVTPVLSCSGVSRSSSMSSLQWVMFFSSSSDQVPLRVSSSYPSLQLISSSCPCFHFVPPEVHQCHRMVHGNAECNIVNNMGLYYL